MLKHGNYFFKTSQIRRCADSKISCIVKLQALRSRSTTIASCMDESKPSPVAANEAGLHSVKSYEEIPTLGIFSMIKSFLPGGKYYKLDSNELLLALKRDFGEIVKLPGLLGRPDVIFTHNVQDFAKVHRNEGVWPKRPGLMSLRYHREEHRPEFFQGVSGVLVANGEQWAKIRTLLNPILMQKQNVGRYLAKMSQVNKEFIERIRQIRDPQSLEVPGTFEEDINRWTLESVSVVALDKQLGLINQNRNDPKAKLLFAALTNYILLSLEMELKPSIWKYYRTPIFKQVMENCDTLMQITSFYINEAKERLDQEDQNRTKETAASEKSVLEKVLRIDQRIATVMAMDMFLTGVDSTSTTFAGILLSLAKNPVKQAKLREEVISILPHKDSDFTEKAYKNMPYLRACIKEAMRLYPLVVGISRSIANDVVLSGYKVPKHTRVTMVSSSLCRDEEHFARPSEYLPERWLRSTAKASICPSLNTDPLKPSNPFVYLPFGFGARSCIGRRIAEMELELGIARVVRNFYIDFNYPTANAFKAALINVPNIPLKFKFTDVEY